jgi:hypothetical protein
MADKNSFHEDFDHGDKIRVGSPRAFGFVFAVVFAVVALWPLLNSAPVRLWAAGVASAITAAAVFNPSLLQPMNRLWFRFGMLLHKIVNPLVMGFLFFLTVTPIALIFRLIGKDPLNRKPDPNCASYWIERDPKELTPESMRNQF